MNDDLISRSALKKSLNEVFDTVEVMLFDDIIAIIDNAPTVDTYTEDDVQYAIKEGHQVGYEMAKAKYERPQGKWINQSQGAKYPCECSECHTEPFCNDEGYVLSDFCPHCGADMREAENE